MVQARRQVNLSRNATSDMSSPYSADLDARSNPRRRQRNTSEDSIAVRQPVKRRKRSALTKETFAAPDDRSSNGIVNHATSKPLVNGSGEVNGTGHVNGASLAIRDRGTAPQTKASRWSRGDDHTELVLGLSCLPIPLSG